MSSGSQELANFVKGQKIWRLFEDFVLPSPVSFEEYEGKDHALVRVAGGGRIDGIEVKYLYNTYEEAYTSLCARPDSSLTQYAKERGWK